MFAGPGLDCTCKCGFRSVQNEVADASRVANDNLKFLQVLRAPCQDLAKADPHEMPKVIAELLMAVRIVATHSEYYTTPERIGGTGKGRKNFTANVQGSESIVKT